MFDESLSGGGLGTLDGRLGFVLQIGILIPIERHRAARLNEGILLSRGEFDDLLRFDVVGRVAFFVDPSHVISAPGSENGTTRHLEKCNMSEWILVYLESGTGGNKSN